MGKILVNSERLGMEGTFQIEPQHTQRSCGRSDNRILEGLQVFEEKREVWLDHVRDGGLE